MHIGSKRTLTQVVRTCRFLSVLFVAGLSLLAHQTVESQSEGSSGSSPATSLVVLSQSPRQVVYRGSGEEVARYLQSDRRSDGSPVRTLVLLGYSGQGYEDEELMLRYVEALITEFRPDVVSIGGTESGIGKAYEVARRYRVRSNGIVSSLAVDKGYGFSQFVNEVYVVNSDSWGGFNKGTLELEPTSKAIVESGTIFVALGGEEIAADELEIAQTRGKRVLFIPMDHNHEKSIEAAKAKGLPAPTDFTGAAHKRFAHRLPVPRGIHAILAQVAQSVQQRRDQAKLEQARGLGSASNCASGGFIGL